MVIGRLGKVWAWVTLFSPSNARTAQAYLASVRDNFGMVSPRLLFLRESLYPNRAPTPRMTYATPHQTGVFMPCLSRLGRSSDSRSCQQDLREPQRPALAPEENGGEALPF